MIAGLDRLIAPANNGFVSGLYAEGSLALYVSNGSGIWNGFPFRLGKSSEIALITLHNEKPPMILNNSQRSWQCNSSITQNKGL
jgi:hypothetical protein